MFFEWLFEGILVISGMRGDHQKSKYKKLHGFKVSVGEIYLTVSSEPEITFDVSIIQLLAKSVFSLMNDSKIS